MIGDTGMFSIHIHIPKIDIVLGPVSSLLIIVFLLFTLTDTILLAIYILTDNDEYADMAITVTLIAIIVLSLLPITLLLGL